MQHRGTRQHDDLQGRNYNEPTPNHPLNRLLNFNHVADVHPSIKILEIFLNAIGIEESKKEYDEK